MGESVLNTQRGPTVEVKCDCAGLNQECVICSGIGSIRRRACMRCGGTGREFVGGPKCIDCRGEGWRDVELL